MASVVGGERLFVIIIGTEKQQVFACWDLHCGWLVMGVCVHGWKWKNSLVLLHLIFWPVMTED